MIKGLTQAGIGTVESIEQFIELASKHGFGAVDTDGKTLIQFIEKQGLEGARSFLKKHNIIIGSIGLSVDWRSSDESFQDGLTQLTQDAKAAASLGCKACCTYVLPSTDLNAAHFMALATTRLRLCAQILGAYGIHLGLEFVGPHHLRTNWKNPFIWDQQSTLDWIKAINEPNVGLLFDAYHWYTNESTVEDIHALKASQIVHVHINDAPELPISEVLDNGRLYPGEGVIDLTSFLKALKHIGYTGVVSQEVLTSVPPVGTADQLISKSADAYTKVFSAAGI
jgi:sugar phosphate isomerase/epimerase